MANNTMFRSIQQVNLCMSGMRQVQSTLGGTLGSTAPLQSIAVDFSNFSAPLRLLRSHECTTEVAEVIAAKLPRLLSSCAPLNNLHECVMALRDPQNHLLVPDHFSAIDHTARAGIAVEEAGPRGHRH